MPGPPVIFFYLSGPYSAAVVRATVLFLLFSFNTCFFYNYHLRTNHSLGRSAWSCDGCAYYGWIYIYWMRAIITLSAKGSIVNWPFALSQFKR